MSRARKTFKFDGGRFHREHRAKKMRVPQSKDDIQKRRDFRIRREELKFEESMLE